MRVALNRLGFRHCETVETTQQEWKRLPDGRSLAEFDDLHILKGVVYERKVSHPLHPRRDGRREESAKQLRPQRV